MDMDSISRHFAKSWAAKEGIHKTSDVKAWVDELIANTHVHIRQTALSKTEWFYDEASGQIVNSSRSFFQIGAVKLGDVEKPLVFQHEIAYLGVICKVFDGVLHFLMQGKIEPGNVNVVQISPTVQATKSNFEQKHGGKKPPYLDWFLNAEKHTIIVDQIQSEQSSRFLNKRNRNIIIMVDEHTQVKEGPRHKWLTLGQIKDLAKFDNYVNMDARTVLSCIPFCDYQDGLKSIEYDATDTALLRSITEGYQPGIRQSIYRYMNNHKMFDTNRAEIIPLYSLKDWETCIENGVEEFVCRLPWPFKIIFCDIEIEGREVRKWSQPMVHAIGEVTLGLFTKVENGIRYFLVKARPEVGCMDKIELSPSVQIEPTEVPKDVVERLFMSRLASGRGVKYNVILSEEGGRFYHEQNLNTIIEIEPDAIEEPPPGYWWCTFYTLNNLVQINNILNIQLRNLLALLEI